MTTRPPFKITTKILNELTQIHEKLGLLKNFVPPSGQSLHLRKENRIRTIHHSLAIEGNTLSKDQITAILEKKRVLGPKNQILEVQNALEVYADLNKFNPMREKDFLLAHRSLMSGLIDGAGAYRSNQVGVFKGSQISHVAPPAKRVPQLMVDLFHFLKDDQETPEIIKACIFHYELEFIHPFSDGNGRMGRLWQQLLLMKHSPVFSYLSTESLIHKKQKVYYKTLEICDRAGESTAFIEFSLEIISKTLEEYCTHQATQRPRDTDRIQSAKLEFGDRRFTRKQYLLLNRGISTATASRDLARAVEQKILRMSGDKSQAVYRFHDSNNKTK
jgi:Fic family protein